MIHPLATPAALPSWPESAVSVAFVLFMYPLALYLSGEYRQIIAYKTAVFLQHNSFYIRALLLPLKKKNLKPSYLQSFNSLSDLIPVQLDTLNLMI